MYLYYMILQKGLIEKMKVKLESGAYLPTKAHPTDAGYDLYARTSAEILPRSYATFDTGVCVEIPKGYVGLVCGRSGLNFKNQLVLGGVGVIDESYRGSIGVQIYNHGEWTKYINKGDRIAQLVIMPCFNKEVEEAEELGDTDRGTGGFGSSGR